MEMGMGIKLVLGTIAVLAIAVNIPAQQPGLRRVSKPPAADSAWALVLQCTKGLGVTPEPGGDLKDVKWYVTRMAHDKQNMDIGVWLAPDTIVMDELFINRKIWLAHELLHHLLRGPSELLSDNPHPYVPFSIPCKVMPWQNGVFDGKTGVLTLPDGTTFVPRDP